jgi:hypothetical protein
MGKVAEELKEIKKRNKAEWKNMPEYTFTEEKPIRKLTIKFETVEDIEEFEKMLGQKIYPTRNSYWFHRCQASMFSNLVYIDEEDTKDES